MFKAPKTLAVGSSPVSVAVGDLSGDGFSDLAVVSGSEWTPTQVWASNGNGTFKKIL